MLLEIEENKISNKNRYRPEIDGLRAFAVIAVIINHINKEILPNGYLGVDIFFVISGFVITSSLNQRPSKNFKDFISGFYQRRIRRLLPALSIFVLIMGIMICLFNPVPGSSLKTGLASLFGLSNIFLFQRSTDYFAQSTKFNVFTHTWSLGVEEQFYILFPFLIWFSGFGKQTKNGFRNLFLILGALTITSLIIFLCLYPTNQAAAYFLMQSRFWEMAAGSLTFITLQKRANIQKSLEKLPPFFVLALIISVMYLPKSLATASTIAVVVLTSVLIASLKNQTNVYKVFTNPNVVYIGLISYSLYLWHWGVLSISRWTIGIHWWSIPFQVALMLVLAIASYRYIEIPFRKDSWFGERFNIMHFGGVVILAIASSLIALGKPLKGLLYLGERTEIVQPKNNAFKKCFKNISKNTICYLVDNKSQKTLWILGDSHAFVLTLGGEEVAYSLGVNLKLYAASGMSFPPIDSYRKVANKKYLQALDDFKLIEKELHKQIKIGDVILLSMRMPLHFGGIYYDQTSNFRFVKKDGSFVSQENYFDEWILSVVKLANIAQKKGAKIIIQTPTPEWEKELNKLCSKKEWFQLPQKTNCQIKSKFFIDEKTGLYRHIFKKINQLSISHENIYLFDTYKVVCPKSICNFMIDDVDIYLDSNHLSNIWARDSLAPEIVKFINEMQTLN